jgi:pilus assembly protein CpaF
MFSIHITDADKNQRTELVLETSAVIGKARECRVRLDGWKIGKEHARVFRSSGGLFIQDLGQFYGTQVNGSRINQHGPLTVNDEIYLGSYKLIIQDKSDDDKANVEVSSQPIKTETKNFSQPNKKFQPNSYHGWRTRIHGQLLDTIDLRRRDILGMEDKELRAETEKLVREIIDRERVKQTNKTYTEGTASDRREKPRTVSTYDYEKIVQDVLSEAVGLGPLEDLLADDSISEIMVNRFDEIFLEKAGKLELHHTTFTSDRAVLGVIERIVTPIGRRIDESSPMVDARLKDGSRVNAIIPPLALKGPALTIRKFSRRALTTQDLINYGSISEMMSEFMRMCVLNRKSIIISGGTGSGKTTLLNVLSNFIPDHERIITIEDAAELRLNQSNLVSLEARPSNAEGRGQIAIRDLVKNALRMRPDRIVVGECRGGEALDMLQAMNTGHEGSLTTLHANNPRDALARLETLILMAGMDLPLTAIREQISSAVDIIIQQARLTDGQRIVTSIVEITGMESGKIQLQDIFRFEQKGRNEQGRVQGKFIACETVPTFYEELRETGVPVDISIFNSQDTL